MPGIRIYAFAKKLGLDNKQLLDICDQVGIKGKGSALASLEEEEVAKVHQYIDTGGSESADQGMQQVGHKHGGKDCINQVAVLHHHEWPRRDAMNHKRTN